MITIIPYSQYYWGVSTLGLGYCRVLGAASGSGFQKKN